MVGNWNQTCSSQSCDASLAILIIASILTPLILWLLALAYLYIRYKFPNLGIDEVEPPTPTPPPSTEEIEAEQARQRQYAVWESPAYKAQQHAAVEAAFANLT